MHGTPKKSVVVLVILCFISTPIVSAGYSDWSLTVPINPDEDGVTISGFSVPSDETVTDGWINVNSEPMANSPSDIYQEVGSSIGSSHDFADGTMVDVEDSLVENSLTLDDDGSLSSLFDFNDNGNLSIDLHPSYIN